MNCEFRWREPTADEDIPEYAVLNSDKAWMVLQVRYPIVDDGFGLYIGEWQDIQIGEYK